MKSRKSSTPSQSSAGSQIRAVPGDTLLRDLEEIRLAITHRAFELFETRGRHHGHDLEDWFQAEAELVSHVSFLISETEGSCEVSATVLGFKESELRVAVEPRRIIIAGKKQHPATTDLAATRSHELHPNLILGVVGLPVEIEPTRTIIEFKAGVLTFALPKAIRQTSTTGAQAA